MKTLKSVKTIVMRTIVTNLRQCGDYCGRNFTGPDVIVAPNAKLVSGVGQQMIDFHVTLVYEVCLGYGMFHTVLSMEMEQISFRKIELNLLYPFLHLYQICIIYSITVYS